MNLLRGLVVIASIGTLLGLSCGNDSSGGDDRVTLCKQWCNKSQSLCAGDSGITRDCDAQCTQPQDGGTGGGGQTCTNEDEITAAFKVCLEKNTCQELTACILNMPACKGGGSGGTGGAGGTGGGGSGGTGGSTGGSGGAGGTSGGGTCADLLACCNRANEMYKASCMMLYNAVMGQGDAVCGTTLTQSKAIFCP